jgi:hypothetical protein
MDADTADMINKNLANMRKDRIYRVTVEQAITGAMKHFSFMDPPNYAFTEGGAGETRWLDIRREGVYKGRIMFTPKGNGATFTLNWHDGPETERYVFMFLADAGLKEAEAENPHMPEPNAAQPRPDVEPAIHPTDQAKLDTIKDKFCAGYGDEDIAPLVGLTPAGVRYHRQKNGWTDPKRRRK